METAEIVNKQINDPAIPVHSDPLLCEGIFVQFYLNHLKIVLKFFLSI